MTDDKPQRDRRRWAWSFLAAILLVVMGGLFLWPSDTEDDLGKPQSTHDPKTLNEVNARRSKSSGAESRPSGETPLSSSIKTSDKKSDEGPRLSLLVLDEDSRPCAGAHVRWIWKPLGNATVEELVNDRLNVGDEESSAQTGVDGFITIPFRMGLLQVSARSAHNKARGLADFDDLRPNSETLRLRIWKRNPFRVRVVDQAGTPQEDIPVALISRWIHKGKVGHRPLAFSRSDVTGWAELFLPAQWKRAPWDEGELVASIGCPCADPPVISIPTGDANRRLGDLVVPPLNRLRLVLNDLDRKELDRLALPKFTVSAQSGDPTSRYIKECRRQSLDREQGILDYDWVGLGLDVRVDGVDSLFSPIVEGRTEARIANFAGPKVAGDDFRHQLPHLRGGVRMSGRILGKEGQSLAGSRFAVGFESELAYGSSEPEYFELDEESRFEISFCPTRKQIITAIKKANTDPASHFSLDFVLLQERTTQLNVAPFARVESTAFTFPEEGLIAFDTIHLNLPQVIAQGRVIDEQGQPIAGASIWFREYGDESGIDRTRLSNPNAVTNSEGRFAVYEYEDDLIGGCGAFGHPDHSEFKFAQSWASGFRFTQIAVDPDNAMDITLVLAKGRSHEFTILVDPIIDVDSISLDLAGPAAEGAPFPPDTIDQSENPHNKSRTMFAQSGLRPGPLNIAVRISSPFPYVEPFVVHRMTIADASQHHHLIDLRGKIPTGHVSAVDENGAPIAAKIETNGRYDFAIPADLPSVVLSKKGAWVYAPGFITRQLPSVIPTSPIVLRQAPELAVTIDWKGEGEFDFEKTRAYIEYEHAHLRGHRPHFASISGGQLRLRIRERQKIYVTLRKARTAHQSTDIGRGEILVDPNDLPEKTSVTIDPLR